MKLQLRYSLRTWMLCLTVISASIAVFLVRHRQSLEKFNTVQALRDGRRNVTLYFDYMVEWSTTDAVYKLSDPNADSLAPVGADGLLAGVFHHDYVCDPRIAVFIYDPEDSQIELVRKLPQVKQVLLLLNSKQSLDKWRIAFPDKIVLSSYSEMK